MSEDKIIKAVSELCIRSLLGKIQSTRRTYKRIKERGMKAMPGSGNKELGCIRWP